MSSAELPTVIVHMYEQFLQTTFDLGFVSFLCIFLNQATGYGSQNIWCLSQARINCEGCSRMVSDVKMDDDGGGSLIIMATLLRRCGHYILVLFLLLFFLAYT